jgi:integrase
MDADGHRVVGPTKTERSRRAIGMSAPVLVLLRRRWVEAGEPKVGWIFPALHGGDKSVQPTWVTATLNKRDDRAGFEPVRFHDLRHIAILRMLNGVDAGGNYMDAVTVAGIVGHSTPNVTLSIYGAGVITGRQREALDILARRGYSAGTPQSDTPQG